MSTPTEIMFVARITSSASSSGMGSLHPLQMARDLARRFAAGQLDARIRVERARISPSPAISCEPVGDVVLNLHAGAAEDAEAVEVADERPVRIPCLVAAVELVARTEAARRRCGSSGSLARARRHQTDVEPCPLRPRAVPRRRTRSRERRVPGGGNWRISRSEQALGLVLGAPDRRGRGDDLRAACRRRCRGSRWPSRRGRRACRAARR